MVVDSNGNLLTPYKIGETKMDKDLLNEEITVREEEEEALVWYNTIHSSVKTPGLSRLFRVIKLRVDLERKKEQ